VKSPCLRAIEGCWVEEKKKRSQGFTGRVGKAALQKWLKVKIRQAHMCGQDGRKDYTDNCEWLSSRNGLKKIQREVIKICVAVEFRKQEF
jgi:hypothetical protein